MANASSKIDRRLRWLCVLVWLLVGIPVMLRPGSDTTRIVVWSAAFAGFGAAMWWGLAARRGAIALGTALVLQDAAVLAMVLTLCDGLEGALLAVVALQLAIVLQPRPAQAWIIAQSLMLAAGIWFHWSLRPAMLLTPPYLGLQLLTYWCAHILLRERDLRTELEGAVCELKATHELLAESARRTERLDLSDELHDVLGHRLVALRLNLEVLARDTPAPALDTARSLVQQVHDDVQGIVDLRKNERGVDLNGVINMLAQEIPHPLIHVDAEDLSAMDAKRSEVLLRCCLEAVTNAVKHARANNLWIALRHVNGSLRLSCRDDGRGAGSLREGRGLGGMRRRLVDVGGRLEIHTRSGDGFRVEAVLPATDGNA